MDYRRFVELRQGSWGLFAHGLKQLRQHPRTLSFAELEQLTVLYRQLLHDHALAKTRYPGTAPARQLQQLVLAGTLWLQRDPGDHLPSVHRFVRHSFPQAIARIWPHIGLTCGLFVLAMLLGFALTAVEPALGLAFLPAEHVAELEAGHLWTESVFAVLPGSIASSAIATNNLTVAITGWAGGALAGLGAFYVVLLNGLMLGAVVATTAHYALASRLLDFIAAHGPLEITLILVTASAGIEVGRALVVAGDRPRRDELRAASRTALTVLLGALPWILLLGFVEGFISPRQALPGVVKAVLGILLWTAFLVFAWRPWTSNREVPPRLE